MGQNTRENSRPLAGVGVRGTDDDLPLTRGDAKVMFEKYMNDTVRRIQECIPAPAPADPGLNPAGELIRQRFADDFNARWEAAEAERYLAGSDERRQEVEDAVAEAMGGKVIHDVPMSNAQARALDDANYGRGNPELMPPKRRS